MASPTLVDDVFNGTVVLIIQHNEEGAHGLVINRPMDLDTDIVAIDLGMEETNTLEIPVMWGGPVSETMGFVIVEDPWDDDEELVNVGENMAVGISREVLRKAMTRANSRFMLCLGYSGWAPGQLESEMASGAWVDVDLDHDLVFDEPFDERWERAILQLGIENPLFLMTRPVDE